MTPLAHQIARDLCRKRMEPEFERWAAPMLNGAHFFEVTEVTPLFDEVAAAALKTEAAGEVFAPCTFLPAPNTWIEWRSSTGSRHAASMREVGDVAEVVAVMQDGSAYLIAEVGSINLRTGDPCHRVGPADGFPDGAKRFMGRTALLLAIINSPGIVGRRIHAPHKGLARELNRAPGIGIGPLHDWHEIKLEIAKPREIHDGEPHEHTLTGRRALHFCRKHIRICNGKLGYVRAHWRGDPAIGIRRARYVVTANPQRAPS